MKSQIIEVLPNLVTESPYFKLLIDGKYITLEMYRTDLENDRERAFERIKKAEFAALNGNEKQVEILVSEINKDEKGDTWQSFLPEPNPYYTIVSSDSPTLFHVGYFDKDGTWNTESDHERLEEAINRAETMNKNRTRIDREKICSFGFWRDIAEEYATNPNILDNKYHALYFAALRLDEKERAYLGAAYPGLANEVWYYYSKK